MMTDLFLAGALLVLALALAGAETLDVPAEKPFIPQGRPLAGLVITLDPGHGGFAHQPGYTGSARGVNSRVVENDLNMLVAAELRHYLHQAGAEVHMTRLDDRRVAPNTQPERAQELGARTTLAEQTRSHLFIAIHHNAAPRATADGVVILSWPTDSAGNDQPLERTLATILRDEISKYVHQKETFDAWHSEHPLVAGTDIPAACVEFGFLTNADFDAWVSRRGAHRDEARGLYEGIVRMWQEHRGELDALRERLFPDARRAPDRAEDAPPADRMPGELQEPAVPRPRGETRLERTARSLWPLRRPPRNDSEASFVLDRFRATLTDPTIFLFDVTVSQEDGRRALRGSTNLPALRDAAAGVLKAVGLADVENHIEVLPSERLGTKRFGVVQIPMALTWAGPAEGSGSRTQLLLGERVFLLDQTPDGGYLLLQGGDGYIGWVREEAVRRMDEADFTAWCASRMATLTRDCLADDFRLPAGASLPVLDDTGDAVRLRLPRGVRATGDKPEVDVPRDHLRLRPAGEPGPGQAAAKCAVEYLTTPYVFGGRSRLGLDCSGLTGVAWAAAGVTLPRDAKQQILVGTVVATAWHRPPLQPGDLLFFCDEDGRVIHAGVSLGGDRFIHAAPPEVQVSSFDPADPLYSETWLRRFVFARRPMP
jgi:N-acetylmuramoyl-L-alanine amidase